VTRVPLVRHLRLFDVRPGERIEDDPFVLWRVEPETVLAMVRLYDGGDRDARLPIPSGEIRYYPGGCARAAGCPDSDWEWLLRSNDLPDRYRRDVLREGWPMLEGEVPVAEVHAALTRWGPVAFHLPEAGGMGGAPIPPRTAVGVGRAPLLHYAHRAVVRTRGPRLQRLLAELAELHPEKAGLVLLDLPADALPAVEHETYARILGASDAETRLGLIARLPALHDAALSRQAPASPPVPPDGRTRLAR
jgi:hypothetical protein